jgi:hypothetical protein
VVQLMRQIGRTVLVLGLGLGLGLGLTTRLEGASRRGDAADLKLSFRSISEREGGGAGTVTATPTGGESRGCADVEVIGDEAAASCSAREIGAEYVDGLMLAPRYPIDSRRDILLVHGGRLHGVNNEWKAGSGVPMATAGRCEGVARRSRGTGV